MMVKEAAAPPPAAARHPKRRHIDAADALTTAVALWAFLFSFASVSRSDAFAPPAFRPSPAALRPSPSRLAASLAPSSDAEGAATASSTQIGSAAAAADAADAISYYDFNNVVGALNEAAGGEPFSAAAAASMDEIVTADESASSLLGVAPITDASSSFLTMDQTRSIPALEEIFTSTAATTTTTLTAAPLLEQQQQEESDGVGGMQLWQGRLLVLVTAAICGTNYPLLKLLDDGGRMPTTVATALRFVFAAAAVGAAVVAQERQQAAQTQTQAQQIKESVDERGPATLRGAEVGLYYGMAYLAQAMGLHSVDASKSAFFTALAVIVVPLLDAVFKNKALGLRNVGTVVLAIGGVALLQLGPSLMAASSAATATATATAAAPITLWSTGDWWCLSQAVFFGIGYWRLEAASHQYPNQSPRIIAGQLVAIAAAVTCWCAVDLGGTVPSLGLLQDWLFSNPFVWQTILWTGLITTALSHYLETVALRVVAASELTVIMTSISLWGSLFAFLTMGEVMTPIAMVGGLSILAGCLLTSTGGGHGDDDGVDVVVEPDKQSETILI